MRDVDEKDKCKTCSKDKFCPRGPYQDACFHFADILSVVNFAQMPQRLVVFFLEPYVDSSGCVVSHIKIKRQMTWNLPSFTKTSKFLGNMTSIMAGLKFEKGATEEEDEESDSETPANGHASKQGPSNATPGGHGHGGHGHDGGEESEEEEHDHDGAPKPRYLDRLV